MFNPISIYIIGDNEIFCEGLSRILFIDFRNIPRFCHMQYMDDLDSIPIDENQVILIESRTAAAAIAAAKSIHETRSDARLILMIDEHNPALGGEPLPGGVAGIVWKGAPYRQLKGVLERLIFGAGNLAHTAEPTSMDGNHATPAGDRQASRDFAALTRRERQIVGHLITGDSNKVIARNLDIAEATVKAHLKIVLRKLRVEGRTKAALYALQFGLTIL